MTFFKRQPLKKLSIPMKYSEIPYWRRYEVRKMYIEQQHGNCYHCHYPLNESAPDFIQEQAEGVDWDLFPENFLESPVHLHHNHDTDMTLGVVHSHCNAVLWFFHGE